MSSLACFIFFHPSLAGDSGISTASTIPASSAKPSGSGSPAAVTTPVARVKRSDTAEDVSAPKISRAVQSKRVFEEEGKRVPSKRLARSPTLHYSPEDGKVDDGDEDHDERQQSKKPEVSVKAPKQNRRTAVKAKAAPKVQDPVPKTKVKAKKNTPKAEEPPEAATPPPGTAQAVKDVLTRKTTAELANARAPPEALEEPPPTPSSSGSEDEADVDTEAPGDHEGDHEQTLKQVQARKAAHARYMRFSRSIRSKRRP